MVQIRLKHFILFCVLSPLFTLAAETQTYQAQPYSKQYSRTGQVAFFKTYHLSFKSAGYLLMLELDEGQTFAQDTLLAQVDTTDLNAELNRLLAEKSYVNQEVVRLRQLKSTDAVSESVLELQKSRSSQLKAGIDRTREYLEAANLTASFAGTVVARMANPGEWLSPGQPVLEVAPNIDNLVVEFGVDAETAFMLQVGQEMALIKEDSGEQLQGVLLTRSAEPNSQTGLYQLKVKLPTDTDARIGQLYQVIVNAQNAMAFKVPVERARKDFNQTAVIDLVDNGKVLPKRFRVIDSDRQFIYLHAGMLQTITLPKP